MKTFVAVLMVGLAAWVFSIGAAAAADVPHTAAVSDHTLARMGLAGMQTISDQEGEQIRGQGYLRFRTMNFTFIWGRPVEVRQLILVGSKTSPAQAIGVSRNYSLVW